MKLGTDKENDVLGHHCIRSCAAISVADAVQAAVVEASIQARNFGYQQILLLSNCKKLVQVFNMFRNSDWKERTMTADLTHLQQFGLVAKLILVPKVILNNIWKLSIMATKVPTHYCWPNMDQIVS